MLATEILIQDHREVMELIDQLENADDTGGEAYSETFNRLRAALELHMQEEEEIFYPALAKYDEFSDIVEDSVPDHEGVRESLAQMAELDPASEPFQETLTEMRAAIEMHVTNEEDHVFPESLEVLGRDEIESLGDEIGSMRGDSGMSRSARM
jgi:iron-sulfur cluster repair protein YtfE (RIC family)